jgi:hypothetical protein
MRGGKRSAKPEDSGMNTDKKERSIPDALGLLLGWLLVLIGIPILVFGGRHGIVPGLITLASGIAFVGPVYYRERSGRAQ